MVKKDSPQVEQVAGSQIGVARPEAVEIGLNGFVPVPGVGINVTRHVLQVRKSGSEVFQAVRRNFCPFGKRRRLIYVNVEVQRVKVVGIQLQHRLHRFHQFPGPLLRLSFKCPLVPGMTVDERVGKQDAHGGVSGMPVPHLTHRPGVGQVERLTVGGCRRGKPQLLGCDQFTLECVSPWQMIGSFQRLECCRGIILINLR